MVRVNARSSGQTRGEDVSVDARRGRDDRALDGGKGGARATRTRTRTRSCTAYLVHRTRYTTVYQMRLEVLLLLYVGCWRRRISRRNPRGMLEAEDSSGGFIQAVAPSKPQMRLHLCAYAIFCGLIIQ